MTRPLQSPLRFVIVFLAVALGVIEVQGLNWAIRTQARFRERVLDHARQALLGARPRLFELLRRREAWDEALNEVLRSCSATEAELFDESGRRLVARPSRAPVEHWPAPQEVQRLREGIVSVFGPVTGDSVRLLGYSSLVVPEGTLVVRIALPAGDLVEDLHERRLLFLFHGIALTLLALIGSLALVPLKGNAETESGGALGAYAEALERLRDHNRAVGERQAAALARMEAEVEDQAAMVRAGELTSGIVHEVRNGLGTILGYARLIERGDSASGVAEAADGIRRECETLETVVRRFLEYVKRETLNLHRFDLGRMLARVVAREGRNRAGVDVVLPESGIEAIGDEELLERAFENLIRNALQAAGSGGRVEIAARRQAQGIVVTIADDGPGLPPDFGEGPRAFRSSRVGGVGLGLPIALKIVGLHRGKLSLDKRHPQGLEVSVRLPEEAPDSTPPVEVSR